MLNINVLATILGAETTESHGLPMDAHWFGLIMFALLLFLLLITMGVANKGRELPTPTHSDH